MIGNKWTIVYEDWTLLSVVPNPAFEASEGFIFVKPELSIQTAS